MNYRSLIGIGITIVVGVAFLPVVGSVVTSIEENSAASEETKLIVRILPIAFIAMLIIGAVGMMAHSLSEPSYSTKKPKAISRQKSNRKFLDDLENSDRSITELFDSVVEGSKDLSKIADDISPFKWEIYGEKLKETYVNVNFYSDIKFEDEVDKRVGVMTNSNSSLKKSIAKKWLEKKLKDLESSNGVS